MKVTCSEEWLRFNESVDRTGEMMDSTVDLELASEALSASVGRRRVDERSTLRSTEDEARIEKSPRAQVHRRSRPTEWSQSE